MPGLSRGCSHAGAEQGGSEGSRRKDESLLHHQQQPARYRELMQFYKILVLMGDLKRNNTMH